MSKFHKPYINEIPGVGWLVYAWSPRWNRYINRDMFTNERDARLTLKALR